MSKNILKCACGYKHTNNEQIQFIRDENNKKFYAQCAICERRLNIKNLGGIKFRI